MELNIEPQPVSENNIYKQPPALNYLFLTEMWERFGFYTAQGLLVLYMTNYFQLEDKQSFVISGLFAGLAYIAGVFGGYIADRWLGFKTTITWGGIALILGYLSLAFAIELHIFYLSLSIIIVGNGLLKPNISGLLGEQYENNSPVREAGFTIFYMGINIGAALSGFSGYIRDYFGWHAPFFCASLGMCLAMFIFFMSRHQFKSRPVANGQRSKLLLLVCLMFVVGVITTLFDFVKNAEWILPSLGVLLLLYISKLTLSLTKTQRANMLLLLLLILSSIIFWMLFYQLFIAANLFVERLVQKQYGSVALSTTLFYASEGVFIILLAPLFALFWQRTALTKYHLSVVNKFACGLLFMGLGFLLLTISTQYPNANMLINPLWVFAAYLLITIGEIFLSPIGLAAITALSPPGYVGLMMGTWFVATGFGGFFAGMIATIAAIPHAVTTNIEKLAIYHHAFLIYALIGLCFAIALFLINLALPTKQSL